MDYRGPTLGAYGGLDLVERITTTATCLFFDFNHELKAAFSALGPAERQNLCFGTARTRDVKRQFGGVNRLVDGNGGDTMEDRNHDRTADDEDGQNAHGTPP